MLILGLDPGLATTGYAFLEKTGSSHRLISVGVMRTSPKLSFSRRLLELHEDLKSLIKKFKPDLACVELLFFSKNVSTGIKVAEARGVILLALEMSKIPYTELTPSAMKASLTGNGRADKKAIQKMVMLELGLTSPIKPDDASDALSLALCASVVIR